MLREPRVSTLDLYTAAGLLLYVLHVGALLPHHLRSQVEARNWFEINWDLLLWPLPSSIFVTLHLLRLPSSKPSLVDKIGKLLLHHLLYLGYSLLKAILRSARDMQIQRWVLQGVNEGRLWNRS